MNYNFIVLYNGGFEKKYKLNFSNGEELTSFSDKVFAAIRSNGVLMTGTNDKITFIDFSNVYSCEIEKVDELVSDIAKDLNKQVYIDRGEYYELVNTAKDTTGRVKI